MLPSVAVNVSGNVYTIGFPRGKSGGVRMVRRRVGTWGAMDPADGSVLRGDTVPLVTDERYPGRGAM